MRTLQGNLFQIRHKPTQLGRDHGLGPADGVLGSDKVEQRHLDDEAVARHVLFHGVLHVLRVAAVVADGRLEAVALQPLDVAPLELRVLGVLAHLDVPVLVLVEQPLFKVAAGAQELAKEVGRGAVHAIVQPAHVLSQDLGAFLADEQLLVRQQGTAKRLFQKGVGGVEVKGLRGGEGVGDVEQDQGRDALGLVGVEALGDGGAPVVAGRYGLVDAFGVQDLGQVLGNGAEVVCGRVRGLGRSAVPEHVGGNHTVLRQPRDDSLPEMRIVGEAMDQEQGRGVL